MEKLEILRTPLGERILRYASLDDVLIWGVLAIILLDWTRVARQLSFMIAFGIVAYLFRKLMRRLEERDRWYCCIVCLSACGFAADWAGLHFMVGAFLSGAVMDADWFDRPQMDALRRHILFAIMPVFFLSTGLRTNWNLGGELVLLISIAFLAASIAGKLVGVQIAARVLRWPSSEASIIGWLLQTKALIMIIFVNVLLDKEIITSETFTSLLIMAVMSTMLTVPIVHPKLRAATAT